VVPSFAARKPTSYRTRQQLISQGLLRQSERWPGYLEAAWDIECTSPSAAAEILRGCSVNGWGAWKSADGQPLAHLDHMSTVPNRTWFIRGSNVTGVDLVQRLWLAEGLVTVAAARLRQGVEANPDRNLLSALVEEDYESAATYNQKQELVEALYVFLTRMKPDDTVCTRSDGRLHVGKVTGAAEQIASEDGRSNLRRPVDWQDTSYEWEELPEELRQKLSVQHDVVDLTTVQALIDGLGLTDEQLADEAEATVTDPSAELPALTARRKLELPEPDQALTDRLHVHSVSWLREVRDLLWDEKQLVFYGPPGTGKTHLALELAEFLGGGPEQVKLVQFHPSYSYEDFFEGYRPKEDPKTKEVAFRLTAGPLRELADRADEEGNRHVPHFLIIDEINRANLAKVFGELYFLLEYRRQTLRLTYSGDDFSLPDNLFIIGTMNTADRSIALVDAAMRRRFAFVELSPRTEPTRGLLRRWLAGKAMDAQRADLLDELNSRIDDDDFKIGPAYLMKPGVDREGGLERTWRTKILPLLEEHHYGEGVKIGMRYGLASLRAALTARGDESVK
jgi:5-methylcytosine-specific restriction protein B